VTGNRRSVNTGENHDFERLLAAMKKAGGALN
jgi:hypothetical protein